MNPINHESAPSDKGQRKTEVVYGAAAISRAIDEPDIRRVFYMLEHGQIPGARKMGRRWALSIPAFRRAMHGEGRA